MGARLSFTRRLRFEYLVFKSSEINFGKNFIDDVEYPLKGAISEEDYDEFTVVMDKQRQQLIFQVPYHRRFLDSLQEKGAEAWCRP